jgi:hypothetical protein
VAAVICELMSVCFEIYYRIEEVGSRQLKVES